MNHPKNIWGLFVATGGTQFPNFYPVGFFLTREEALEKLTVLSKNQDYQLIDFPLNKIIGVVGKNEELEDGIGWLHHEHYHYKSESEEIEQTQVK